MVANAQEVRAISHARVKTDRFDARDAGAVVAGGHAAGGVGLRRAHGALRRRLARRAALVRQRTRAKNEVHAVISRACTAGRRSAICSARRPRWLAGQELAEDERETVEGCLRQIDFLDAEIALVDGKVAQFVLGSAEVQRLMTIPGVDVTTAAALVAAIGDIARFPRRANWSATSAWIPRSASPARSRPATAGSPSAAMHRHAVLVEAAWTATRTRGRCAPSASGSAPAAARRSPPSRSRASSP